MTEMRREATPQQPSSYISASEINVILPTLLCHYSKIDLHVCQVFVASS